MYLIGLISYTGTGSRQQIQTDARQLPTSLFSSSAHARSHYAVELRETSYNERDQVADEFGTD